MEAISSLVRGHLPPVGNHIAYQETENRELPRFDGYSSTWVDSGTSALALAFIAAKRLRTTISAPEVIVPGYCCPDLLVAAHYAGLKPVIVDINVDDPSLNLTALKQAISGNTIAIVAINFLGICEQYQALLDLKIEHPQLFIVEDNAQWFPDQNEENLLFGDFVTFSFGRGKPVSLLGGGLLLAKPALPAGFLNDEVRESSATSARSEWIYKGKLIAYNQLLKPFFYQLLSRNPFISLGNTEYHPLAEITPLDEYRQQLLPINVDLYLQRTNRIANQYDQLFQDIGFVNKLNMLGSGRRKKLLRYPVLFASAEDRQKVFKTLSAAGLGVTEMYREALPDIKGVHNFSVPNNLDNAHSFAGRFISLPVHSGVKSVHLDLIRKAFVESR